MTGVMTSTDVLLRAERLRAAYNVEGGRVVAVDDVSIEVRKGEVLGVAGESGCGKSTLGSILSLTVRPPLYVLSGSLEVDGKQLDLGPDRKPPRSWRGEVVSLLPQGAMNSLSPTVRIRDFAYDVIRAHQPGVRRDNAIERARQRLEQLDLPARVLDYYPHQLSGGMKQRVVTVISTLLDPRLLIADEPTSALDVSSQRILIEMLREMLKQDIIGGVIFITHDLPVLNTIADRIAVMYAGKIAEVSPATELINRPRHPYSASLLSSVLVPEPHMRQTRVRGIPGAPPSLAHPPDACRFHPRCPLVMDICRTEDPPRVGDERRHSLCWWADQHPGQTVEVGR
ncbi:ABC transporter ATP-binding protein [Actinopolymorpha rutila]|uniref:Peptide/nickel transport system ATP-binding protein n=1 Tax=Actinopolymorpha rutila TaxID=446787 RepID=A0A852ZIQ8_9ACTN|nr:ABC transporter ATP-binding protein [Actinopolymorpha rutila]NYH91522.1 peptide/nickel transport system ATP-binding protein [Actinopolymorpha rutila]